MLPCHARMKPTGQYQYGVICYSVAESSTTADPDPDPGPGQGHHMYRSMYRLGRIHSWGTWRKAPIIGRRDLNGVEWYQPHLELQ